jgi:hypothetical protein
MEDQRDELESIVARRSRREGSEIFDHLLGNHWRVQLPGLVTAEKEVAVIAFQITALADFEDDIQILKRCGLHDESSLGLQPRTMRPSSSRIGESASSFG